MSESAGRGNAAPAMARLDHDGVIDLDAIRELGGGEMAAEVRRTGRLTEEQMAQLGGTDVLERIIGVDPLQRLADEGVVSLDAPAREIVERRSGRGQGTIEQQRLSILFHDWFVFIEYQF